MENMGTSKCAMTAPHEGKLNQAPDIIGALRAFSDIAEDEAEPEPMKKAIPNRLEFFDMPGKEPQWKVTHFGEAIIPSPIPVLPKALALSYRNFFNHYGEYEFIKREKGRTNFPRVVVSCSFVSAMLRQYFPSREYTVKEVWPGISTGAEFTPVSVVNGVPIAGTRYWMVQKQSDDAMVILVVIVTDPEFTKLPARMNPVQLAAAAAFLDSRHRLAVHGDRMSRGVVLLLAGAGTPVKPTFEFYSFDASRGQKGVVMPLVDQKQLTQGVATNSISLAPDHAEQVDQMFKIIVRSSFDRGSWPEALPLLSTLVTSHLAFSPTPVAPLLVLPPSSTPGAPILAPTTKRKAHTTLRATPEPKTKRSKRTGFLGTSPLVSLALTPASPGPSSPTLTPDYSTRHIVDVKNDKTRKMEHHELSEAYVRTVKRNRAGNLIEENGKMIQNGKSKAIRHIAEVMGHTFRQPNHSKSAD
jgi:hypothetical protein